MGIDDDRSTHSSGLSLSEAQGRARFGFHSYNDQDDVAVAVKALHGLT